MNGSTISSQKILSPHRRRIYTEEKAKVVTAVWGTEFIPLVVALEVLHQDDIKKRIDCTRLILR